MKVEKPARYIGGELNAVIKNPTEDMMKVAFCFPEKYEIGMSNLGLQILYKALNEIDDVYCERVFAPWVDMEEEMRKRDIKLFSLESGDEIRTFNMIGF